MSLFGIGQKLSAVGKEQELLDASRTGNLATIEKLLPSKQEKSKRSTVGKLTSIWKSVSVNCVDRNGYTPLHHAAVNGHRDVVEGLLRAGAEPGLQDNAGCTPVHLAAWRGNAEIVMQLLNAGTEGEPSVEPVQVNKQNNDGATALHSAAQYGHVAAIDVLLQKSANPTIRNLENASPLDLAAQYGRLEVVQRLLISNPELAHRPASVQSPLHLASRNGHYEVVLLLLDNNFDIQTQTDTGTALHEAALHGKLDVVCLLLERGINIHEKDAHGQTALELVSKHKGQHKSFSEVTEAIKMYNQKTEGNPDGSGLYDSLALCRSGSDAKKPTAAVRPLPKDKPSHSDTAPSPPSPSLKPHLSARPSPLENPPHTFEGLMLPKPRARLMSTPGNEADKPVPAPRYSMVQLSPDEPPESCPTVPLYTLPNKDKQNLDRVVSSSSSTHSATAPPLPPRTSVFAPENKESRVAPEKAVRSVNIPKKPPRHKKSPMPARKSDPSKTDNSKTESLTEEPHSPTITSTELPVNNDSAKSDSTSQHSLQCSDQSDSKKTGCDVTDSSVTGSNDSKSNIPAKTADSLIDNSVSPVTGKQVSQSVYLEMTAPKQRPVSEVKPQIQSTKLQEPSEQGVDNYGILFPNLKKRPELTRTNTAPESESMGPSPISPTEKFKEKQGLLKRSNTAPEENTYIPMDGTSTKAVPDIIEPTEDPEVENEYSEIPEKSPSSEAPPSPLYASIGDDMVNRESIEYSQIKDITPPASPDKPCEEKPDEGKVGEEAVKVGDKPNHLEFKKPRKSGLTSGTPLTPTGYAQPPTPDFPPPSPATALLGIEMKIQEIDSKRKSRDITTITDETALGSIKEQTTEVKATDNHKVKVTGQKSNEVIDSGASGEKEDEDPEKDKNQINESKTDSADSQTVIEQETKNIPESSIPTEADTVIDCSEDSMSKNKQPHPQISPKPPVPQKPRGLGDSFKSDKPGARVSIKNSADQKRRDKENVKRENGDESESKKSPNENLDKNLSVCSEVKEASSSIKTPEKEEKPTEAPANTGGSGEGTPTAEGGASPVVMRRPSRNMANQDLDVFKGLLRGSTVGVPRKATSQFYDDVLRKSRVPVQDAPASALVADLSKMDHEEDIDLDAVMKSIDVEVAKRASLTQTSHDAANFDDAEEWEKIADIMSSFSGDLTNFSAPEPESPTVEEFNVAFEAYMDRLLDSREQGEGQMVSVGEWLESLGLSQYENNFIANGFDNIDFLDPRVLEEQDLEQIGVLAHGDRQKILASTKALPQLMPIDTVNPPASVEEWLTGLHLRPEYLDTFLSHGYDTIDKVQSILWDIQLRTVLDISMLGHRKRILASLGERKPLDRQNSQTKRTIAPTSPEHLKSPLDINLFKDYRNVKPVSTSEEPDPTPMAVDSSEDEDVFKKHGGQSIRNSSIHLRPPHLAQVSSPARQWRHKPEMLIKGCCNYTAQYLGSTIVTEITAGIECTKTGITKLKLRFMRQLQKSAQMLAKIPIIMLSISYKGVKFIDAKSKRVICDHEIGNIFCACQDTEHLNFFAYITRDIETCQHYCHVFSVKSPSLAHDIILTLGESFEVAFQMAMKEKSLEEAMELDRKMSHSDAEDSRSTSSKFSTDTV
ncbi:ankyrin repeat and sterile alpha motif domain-containing protein 1B-like isoform X2 [Mya arenaria]|uniref:ankyrin repeat and sterile alpha motif domain-containing protein 1B-like isoform X2 n=1 Tax=Mya arenaria TaxID=6604 RepID=UPI0022E747DD|nr:ankyrin repeat and sterile alpha motif domain-containing protein 1B-like isoform X2 [Mya arenaria]